MHLVGLTGGVGSGKSTIATMLSRRGAVVIDADDVARQVVAPGTTGLDAVVARFGRAFLRPDGTLDRRALADLVFTDDEALHDLNHIVHPLVRSTIAEQVDAIDGEDVVVVLVVPLLVESGQYPVDSVIVVDCDEEVAVQRLVAQRGWTVGEARQRMAAQTSRERRRAAADLVIDNSAPAAGLDEIVDGVWRWIAQRSAVPS